jgi:FdhD protein
MDEIEGVQLSKEARLKTFGSMPSEKDQYCAKPLSQGGSDQGCVFCKEDRPPISVEDGGRHNAVDKIALYGAE